MENEDRFEFWKKNAFDEEVKAALAKLSKDPKESEDCFYKELSFGTAGVRGKLGAGTNRINIYTVSRFVHAYSLYLKKKRALSVAISFDSRHNSQKFAEIAACIIANEGLKVYLTHTMQPTPFLSYAIRKLKADGGVMFTASHNSKDYSGFKFYNNTGCQVNEKAVEEISRELQNVEYFDSYKGDLRRFLEEDKVEYVTDKLKMDYLDEVFAIFPGTAHGLRVTYSPLNGTGWQMVPAILERLGIKELNMVTAQSFPNENFTTCPLPDPQKPETFRLAISSAKRSNSDIVILTDPDCDRVGVAVLHKGQYEILDGNAIAALMTEFVLSRMKKQGTLPEHPVIVRSVVTTPIVDRIAHAFGAEVEETMIGFKHIGAKVTGLAYNHNAHFVIGMEESCGYLVGSHVREKDAVIASSVLVQMCSAYKKRGTTLVEKYNQLKNKYGNFKNKQISFEFDGVDGERHKEELLSEVRELVEDNVGGIPVTKKIDLLTDEYKNFGKCNMLVVELIHGNKIVIRPSGTEPLIRLYLFANESDKEGDVVLDTMEHWARRIFC